MLGFFAKRPAIGVLAILGGLVFGATMAHRSRASGPSTSSLSFLRPKPNLQSGQPAAVDWRPLLSVERAELRQGKLVQRLQDGTRVTYTLDPKLQQWAKDYLRSYDLPYAAMVMLDVQSGKVLVMAGHASANPKVDTRQLCLKPWAPAASVFKLVTAAALLDRGVSADATVCYHGGEHGLRKHNILDNPKIDKTCKSLSYAVAKSINPVMGKLAVRHLSAKHLEDWSYRFGFNRPIPFDLPVQPSQATIPDGDLDKARVAAGFWKSEASVLHGALIAGVAASRGQLLWPRLVEEVAQSDGRKIIPFPPEPERVMSRSAAEKLAAMMVETTRMGTGRSFRTRTGEAVFKFDVGGKTGSLSRSNPFLHYSWFVGFAPANKPKVAFAVLLGNPEKWKIKAHTAARTLLGRYVNPDDGSKPKAGTAVAKAKKAKAKPSARPARAAAKVKTSPAAQPTPAVAKGGNKAKAKPVVQPPRRRKTTAASGSPSRRARHS
jgi:cell division protein FtsI/penicillin-binding protein 2